MMRTVFFVWLSTVVISTASNPAAQKKHSQQCNVCQSNPHQHSNAAPTNFQQVATQTNPYPQQVIVQNQTPNQPGMDGASQLLMNKIFENPGLQKILDPNTKLYNQNGQEIQRQPNTGSVPNIINNYFIVPPEFFLFNDTKTKAIPKKEPKRRRNNSNKKGNLTKSKPKLNAAADNVDPIKNFDQNNRPKSNNHVKERKRNQSQRTKKITEENDEVDVGIQQNKANIEVNNTKQKRKQGSSSKNNTPIMLTPPPSDDCKEDFIDEIGVACPVIENNKPKRRKSSRKESNGGKLIVSDSSTSSDAIKVQDTVFLKNKVVPAPNNDKLQLRERKAEDILDIEPERSSRLKNIESPVDNLETKSLIENRQTRNSKVEAPRNGSTKKFSSNPDDILKNFFPHLYTGNSFYPNFNYPFNLEQFYGPYCNRSNKKPKRRKSKNNNNEQNKKGSQPKVVEVKLKPTMQTLTTTANPLPEESTEETYPTNLETTTQMTESVTNIPMTIPRKEMVIPLTEDKLKSEVPKATFLATKASLEMPPTMIEDLQDYIIPELGREDIIPTIHSNGIINDYYPVFHDDFIYSDDESYYLKDLEDERHFYSTDHGHEDLLNRERRKYDRNGDYRVPSLDIKDRINFRRGYKYRENDGTKNFDDGVEYAILRPYANEKLIEDKHTPVKTTSNEEFNFQSPPLLEHPDFNTKKIEKESLKTDYSDEYLAPIYTEYYVEKVSDKPEIYSNIKSFQFDKLEKFDKLNEDKSATNNKPKNDRIETVFAKTRVVKYGAAKDESEENTSISIPHQNGSDKYYGDGTTYVVAKSLGYDDDFYW